MNIRTIGTPNKYCYILALVLLLLSLTIIDALAIHGGDVGSNYIKATENNYISDWHSSLFYSELVLLNQMVSRVFPDAGAERMFIWLVRLIVFTQIASFSSLIAVLQKRSPTYTYLIPLWAVSLFLFNLFSRHFSYWGNLEFFFFAVLTLFFPAGRICAKQDTAWKIIGIVICTILSIHLLDFRKNSILIMPLIWYAVAVAAFPSIKRWRKVLISVVMSVISIGSTLILTNQIIPSARMHSASVMLVSDIKIAAHLKNQLEDEELWLMENCSLRYPARTKYKLRADSENQGVDFRQADVINRYALSDKQWEILKERYKEYWLENTLEMLWARILSSYHLFVQIETHPYMKQLLMSIYPHVQMEALGLPDGVVWENNIITYKRLLIILPCVICVGMYVVFVIKMYRKMSIIDEMMLITIGVMLLYAHSYLVLVPAAFARYHCNALLVLLLLTPLVVIRMLDMRK